VADGPRLSPHPPGIRLRPTREFSKTGDPSPSRGWRTGQYDHDPNGNCHTLLPCAGISTDPNPIFSSVRNFVARRTPAANRGHGCELQRLPLDEGIPCCRGSSDTASRNARAVPLNNASAMWCELSPWCSNWCRLILELAETACQKTSTS